MTAVSDPAPALPPPSPIDCEAAVRRLWDYLDGRVSVVARGEIEAHLATCALCPPHFVFAERMKAALTAAAAPVMPQDDEQRLRARVRAALARFALDGQRRHDH